MRFSSLCILGLLILMMLPCDLMAQSKTPYSNKPPKAYRPQSKSRMPVSKRPIASRRSLAYMQKGWETGAGSGVAFSLTDASGTAPDRKSSFLNTQWSTANINAGFFARYRFDNLSAINTTFNYARIGGADSIAGRSRGFYFQNQIMEIAVRYEMFHSLERQGFPFELYGFLGLAAFYHNPQLHVPDPAPVDFTWDEFSQFQPAIPIGWGINYKYSNNFKFGYEVGYRKTFFDYLDGFTRPWSRATDSYYFNTVKVTYIIRPNRPRW
jgi:hypothetical protein